MAAACQVRNRSLRGPGGLGQPHLCTPEQSAACWGWHHPGRCSSSLHAQAGGGGAAHVECGVCRSCTMQAVLPRHDSPTPPRRRGSKWADAGVAHAPHLLPARSRRHPLPGWQPSARTPAFPTPARRRRRCPRSPAPGQRRCSFPRGCCRSGAAPAVLARAGDQSGCACGIGRCVACRDARLTHLGDVGDDAARAQLCQQQAHQAGPRPQLNAAQPIPAVARQLSCRERGGRRGGRGGPADAFAGSGRGAQSWQEGSVGSNAPSSPPWAGKASPRYAASRSSPSHTQAPTPMRDAGMASGCNVGAATAD